MQDLLLASNPQDGVSGKWVLRRTAASRPKSGGASVQAAAPAIAPPRVKSAATPAVPAAPAPAPAAESPTTDGSTTAPALVAPPGSDTVGLATKASADFAAPQAGFTRVPALAYTRQRILAFRNAVMGGGAAGSAMPMDTQVRGHAGAAAAAAPPPRASVPGHCLCSCGIRSHVIALPSHRRSGRAVRPGAEHGRSRGARTGGAA